MLPRSVCFSARSRTRCEHIVAEEREQREAVCAGMKGCDGANFDRDSHSLCPLDLVYVQRSESALVEYCYAGRFVRLQLEPLETWSQDPTQVEGAGSATS